MKHRLCLIVSPLPASTEIPHLRETLKSAFPSPENSVYFDALMGHSDVMGLSTVVSARLGALSLLSMLAARIGMKTTDLRLFRDPNGRPYVTDSTGKHPFDFNLTHSATHMACALLTGGGRVGLDIEEPIPPTRASALISRYATKGERAMLNRQSIPSFIPSPVDFTRLWTIREAVSKYDGGGRPWSYDAATLPPGIQLLCGHLTDTGAALTLCFPAEVPPDAIELISSASMLKLCQ